MARPNPLTPKPQRELPGKLLELLNAGRVDEFAAELERTCAAAGDLSTGLRDVAQLYARFDVR